MARQGNNRKRRREQALKSTVLQPFLNVVDWCLESNQAFKLSHPNAYHRVLLVLQPVFILLYLYDVYSDIQVAQVYFKANDYVFAGFTIFFITFHYVLTGGLLTNYVYRKLHMRFPELEKSQAGNSARRTKRFGYLKRLWRILNWTNELTLLMALCVVAVPFLDLSLLFRAIFPFIYYYLGANEDFMLQYAHIRHPMECFLESFPQTIIQVVYWRIHSSDTKDSEKWILLSSLGASAFNLLLNLLGLMSAARTSGFSWRRYFRLTLTFKGATHLPVVWRQRLNERILVIDRSIVGMEDVQRKFLWNQIARRGYVVLCNVQDVSLYYAILKAQRAPSAALIAVDAADFLMEVCTELPWRLIERNRSSLGKQLRVYFDFGRVPELPLLGYGNAAGAAPKPANTGADDEEEDPAAVDDDDDDDVDAKDDVSEDKRAARMEAKALQQRRTEGLLDKLTKRSGELMVAGFISKFYLRPLEAGKRGSSLGKQLWLDGLARVSFQGCGFNLKEPSVLLHMLDAGQSECVRRDPQLDRAALDVWEGLRALASAPNLQLLDLSGNMLDAGGLHLLAHLLGKDRPGDVRRLQELRLRNIGFSAAASQGSEAHRGIGSSVLRNAVTLLRANIAFLARRAARLDLSENALPCNPAYELLLPRSAVPAPHELLLEGCSLAAPHAVAAESDKKYLSVSGLEPLFGWQTGIEHLSLAGTPVFSLPVTASDPDAQPLLSQMLAHGYLQQLRSLDLSRTGLTSKTPESWLVSLLAGTSLELQKHLTQQSDGDHEDDQAALLLPHLRSLSLSGNALGDAGIELLAPQLAMLAKSLADLSLSRVGASLAGLNSLLSMACNIHRWQVKQLRRLDLSHNAGYLPCASQTPPAPGVKDPLEVLRVECGQQLVRLLRSHRELRFLDVSGVHFSWLPGPCNLDGSLMMDLLKAGRALVELRLNDIPFGNDGAALLAEALKERMKAPNSVAGPQGADASQGQGKQAPGQAASSSSGGGGGGAGALALRVLSLSRVNMDSLGFGFLLDALAFDPEMPLELLDVSYNRIRYLDMDEWKRFLAVNRRLQSLDLQFNLLTMDVWTEAAGVLEDALKARRSEWFWERDGGWGAQAAEQLEVLV